MIGKEEQDARTLPPMATSISPVGLRLPHRLAAEVALRLSGGKTTGKADVWGADLPQAADGAWLGLWEVSVNGGFHVLSMASAPGGKQEGGRPPRAAQKHPVHRLLLQGCVCEATLQGCRGPHCTELPSWKTSHLLRRTARQYLVLQMRNAWEMPPSWTQPTTAFLQEPRGPPVLPDHLF